MKKALAAVCFAVTMPLANADQGGFLNSGGSLGGGSQVSSPPGALTISANILSFITADGSTAINAAFTTSSTVESCSGGGKGGNVTCSFTFKGTFSGTLTVNGSTQAINGSTYQVYGTNGIVASGNTGYNSAYTPFYFTDGNARILRSDDLSGSNAIAYGTQGTGVGQFYGPSGIALDSAGRIYVTDTYNDRIVRMDDMNGTNWTSFGAYGAGVGQFARPQSISIDPAGHIWVLDNGNGRLIRMDDVNGTNWTTVGSAGAGVGQFGALSSAPGFDALGRIYVADTGNRRIVRFDDLSFTNWTALSQSQPIGPYIFLFSGPIGVVTDQGGKLYVADGSNVIRVDDMTGANWTSINVGTFAPHTIAIDSSGMVILGNGYNAQIVDSEATVLTSNINGLVQGVYVSVYGAAPLSLPSPRPSAINFTPAALTFSQNVGSPSAAQNNVVTNFGGSPIGNLALSAAPPFSEMNNCPVMLFPAASCTVSVTFTPPATGPTSGTIALTDDSYNLGSSQTLLLSGTGTAPGAAVAPTSLSFSSQIIGTSSAARNVTLQSSGSGPLQVQNISVTGPFTQSNNCNGSIAPAASCTIAVVFSPTVTGSASGVLTITDTAGTQTANLSGTGNSPVTLSSTSLNFGSLAVGSTSAATTVTVTNRLSATLTFTGISVLAGGPFAISSNTCGTSIAAGASCAVGVTFTPAALGAASGTLTFADSAINSPQTVSLTGTGAAPVSLSVSSLSFGTVTVGATSSSKTVTLTNHLSVALALSPVTVTSGFSIASNTCATSVAAGANCSVGVTFTPTAIGAATGTLTFTDSGLTSPQTVSLNGTGGATSSPVTLSASTPNFGTVTVGATAAAMTVTLTNRQSVALTFSSIGITGVFAISSNTCGTGIGAGASCSVGVTFSPTAAGAATGTLTFADNATNSPQKVSLSGSGSTPVSLSTTALNFGVVAVGSASPGQTVTVTNAGAAAVAVNGIAVTGDFAETNTCASSLPATNNCTVTVTFAPSTGGTRTGTLTLNPRNGD